MKRLFLYLFLLIPLLVLNACGSASATKNEQTISTTDKNETPNMTAKQTTDTNSMKIKFVTTEGDFTVLLYGDTPLHRDNFIKLVKEGFYNGTLFHRVINKFMIQAGDPDSKNAAPGTMLGSGGPGYTIPAEIVFPKHYHKRGSLAAARQGDNVNPERRSSGSQFYIVTGNRFIPAQLDAMENSIKGQQLKAEFNRLAAQHMDKIRSMQIEGDTLGLRHLQEQLISEAEANVNVTGMTAEMREAYSTVGGAPHLDGQYTVFGEVIDGMDVIDKIEKAETDSADRPKTDIKIISAEILD